MIHPIPVLTALLAVVGVHSIAFAQGLDGFLDDETLELAAGYDKRLRYTPSTVSVFDQAEIARTGALNLAELLERVVGIHISRKSFGSSADQFVRGIDGNLLILHNGVEIAKQIPELLAMPLVDVRRVEVVKGSHYPLYGPTAVVGTVNIVTEGPRKDERSGGLRAGTSETIQGWGRVADVVGDIGYSAYASHTRTQTTAGEIAADRQTPIDALLSTNASFAPGEGAFDAAITDARLTLELGQRWTVHQFFNHRELGTGVGLAQALDPSGEERVSRYTSDLRFDTTLGRGDLETRLTYHFTRAEYVDTLLLPPGTLGGLFPEGVLQSYGQTGQEVFGEALYRIALGRHTLDVGVGGSRGEVRNDFDRRNYTFEPGSDLPTPIGETMDFSESAPLFRDDYSVTTAHLIARDEWQLSDDLSLTLGLRLDHSSDYGTFRNPRIGLDWTAGQYTGVAILYGESAIEPSEIQQTSNGLFSPLGSDDLEPAKIRLFEIAFDHDFRNGFSLSANLFAFQQVDVIGVVPDVASPIGTRFDNLSGNEDGSGAEILVNWRPSEALRLSLGGAYQSSRSDDLDTVVAPSFQPYLELNAGPSRGWNINIAAIGVHGRERAPGDDRAALDDYTVVNLTALRKSLFIDGLDLSLSAQNVFDTDAREDISEAIVFDLPVYPRRLLFGVTYGL